MVFPFSQLNLNAHQKACAWKQQELKTKIDALPTSFHSPLSASEHIIHSLSLAVLVDRCSAGKIAPQDILSAYGKKTLDAHHRTNCLSDLMLAEALHTPAALDWGVDLDADDPAAGHSSRDRSRVLMGVPVSVKDTLDVAGHDTTIGYSRNVNRPAGASSAMVRLLQDAGALVHAKTTVPTGLLGLETATDLFGRTSNPHNPAFVPGASTGGGAALAACRGSMVEIGTDLAGSVRIPAHFCGIFALKASAGRFPNWGNASSLPGLEAVQLVSSPLAARLDDLEEFSRRVVECRPWEYDHTCVPLPWRPVNLREEGRRLKWGVVWSDGVIPPTPACRRALSTVVDVLRRQGHEVVDFTPPDLDEGFKAGYKLLFGDGGKQLRNALQPSESPNAASAAILDLLALPRLVKRALAFLSRQRKDFLSADMAECMQQQSVLQERQAVVARDTVRAAWHAAWAHHGLDFVLTVAHPLPAFEHGASAKTTLLSAGYTFIFNLLDYTAGVVPVTRVDKAQDALPSDFFASHEYKAMTTVAQGAYTAYDAAKMHGLPVGIQVAGRRLEEEKVLEGMRVIVDALQLHGAGDEEEVSVPSSLWFLPEVGVDAEKQQ